LASESDSRPWALADPSPDEIRQACERIRATWSEAKHQDRGWKKTVPFNWPRVSDQELIEAIDEEERGETGDS